MLQDILRVSATTGSEQSVSLITREENKMKKRLCWIIAVVSFLILLVVQAESQEINLRGYVRGTDGRPISSASVKLIGPGNYIALTNSKGEFFINVIPGPYRITVWQGNNFQEFSRNIKDGALELIVKW
jgi:hypothetical protein